MKIDQLSTIIPTRVRPRFHYLDFLRGLAILYIVAVRHLDDYAHSFYRTKFEDIITYSFLGLFMYISGYLLSINNPINNKRDLTRYTQKRFLRIYPLFVIALFLFRLCSIMTFRGVVIHMLLLNILLNNSVLTLWFVSLICVFYILFPIIIYKYSVLKTLATFVVVLLVSLYLRKEFGLLDKRLILFFPLFLFGVVSSKNELIERYLHNKLMLACSVSLFAASSFFYVEFPKFKFVDLIFLMMTAIPFWLLIGKFFASKLKRRLYENIAYASFCMYLFHRIIFYVITKSYSPTNDIYTVCYLTLFAVPAIYIISFFFQKTYDNLTNRWRLV